MTFPLQPLKRLVDPSRGITYGIVQAGEHVPDGVPYVRPIDMAGHSGVDVENLQRTSAAIAASYRRSSLRTGDVVVSIGPSFGKTLRVPEELDGANLTQGTARVAVCRGVNARFILWCLQSKTSTSYWESSVGGATFRALNLGPLSETPTPTPPLKIQRQIADYLDHETAEIDAFITELDALKVLEVERRAAAVSTIVWDPATPRIRMKYVAEILSGFPYRSEDFVVEGDGAFRLLRGVNVGVSRIDWSELVSAPASVVEVTSEYALREGDLVLGLDRPVIRAGVRAAVIDRASAGSFLLQRVARIRGLSGRVLNGWLLRALQDRRFIAYLEPDFTGVSVPHISPGQVGEFRVPVPGIEEQARCLKKIEGLEKECEVVLADTDAAIALAKERRAALITAAVTGQIDVTSKQVPAVDSIQSAIEESR